MSKPFNLTFASHGHFHALVKSISYRMLGTALTGLTVLALTGELKIALGVGVLEFVSKIALFYLHERAWDKVARRWN